MITRMFTFALILVASVLSGCLSVGADVKDDQLSSFQVGVTTHADVVGALGQPQSEVVSSSGERSLIYVGSHMHVKPGGFIPIVGIFMAGGKGETTSVTFRFDRNGKLAEATTSRTDLDTNSLQGRATITAVPTTMPVRPAPAPVNAAVQTSTGPSPPAVAGASSPCRSLGVDLARLSATGMGIMDGATGAMVTAVSPTGAGASSGIHKDDILIRVADSMINDPADVQQAICNTLPGIPIDVKLSRATRPVWVSVQF
jgi:hypothetical protein